MMNALTLLFGLATLAAAEEPACPVGQYEGRCAEVKPDQNKDEAEMGEDGLTLLQTRAVVTGVSNARAENTQMSQNFEVDDHPDIDENLEMGEDDGSGGFVLPAMHDVDEEGVNVTSESALLDTHVDEWNWYGSWEETILLAHNKYRCMHQVPEFKWDWKLARQAEAFAKKKIMGHSSSSSRPGAGENAAWGNKGDAKKAVKMWYDEIKNTNGGQVSSFAGNTGHYSQVVWKGSLKVGCGRSVGSGNPYGAGVFCQYSPAGNYHGRFNANVNGPKVGEKKCSKLRDSQVGSIGRCWSNYGNAWCYTRDHWGYYATSKCESYNGYGINWCCPDKYDCKEGKHR